MIGESVYEVSEGALLLIDEGQTHSFYELSEDFCLINFILKPDYISNELINSSNILEVFTLSMFDDFEGEIEQSVRVVHFVGEQRREVNILTEKMCDEFINKPLGYRSAISGYMNVLFAHIIRAIQGEKNVRI